MGETKVKAIDLLEWNERLPVISIVNLTPEGSSTEIFGIRADYGWAERIICEGMYHQDALMIEAAINEALEKK